MKRGDVVFIQGKSIISRIVRLIDGNGEFSHVAIAVSEKMIIEADVGIRVALRPLRAQDYAKMEIVDLGLSDSQRNDVYNESLKFIGSKYDYIQLIWYGLRKIFNLKGRNRLNNPNNVICSELVFNILDSVGILDDLCIKDYAFNGADLTPNEIYDLVKYLSR